MKAQLILAAAAFALVAAEPAGVVHWRAAELKAFAKKLSPKINAQKVATEQMGQFGNHSVMVAHREGDGESELHEKQADIFIVQTGEADFVVGGEIVGGKTTAPGEIRGKSINGGQKMKLSPGDVVHIPAKVPHQVLVSAGRQFTYLIVKVDAP